MCKDIKILENNVKQSFSNAKTEVNEIRNTLKQHSDIIKQLNENIKQLHENQKILLQKLKEAKHNETKEYVGATSTMKVHNSVCPFAKNIKPANRIVFNELEKALNEGYKPCNCLKKV